MPNSTATPAYGVQNSAKLASMSIDVSGSGLEQLFAAIVKRYDLPPPVREFAYALPRRFRADFAWPKVQLLVELEGGVWGRKSGHNSGTGIETDCKRSRLASLHGYRVFRITRKALDENEAEIMAQLTEILKPWYMLTSIETAGVSTPDKTRKPVSNIQTYRAGLNGIK